MEKELTLKQKLLAIQTELVAPKGNYNSFGKYNYRNCEDIYASVKPLVKKYNVTLVVSDGMESVGERYYVKATATLFDENSTVSSSAYAREEEDKKGMDASQITGSASSYARKYALCGLFLIDGEEDADATNGKQEASIDYRNALIAYIKEHNIDAKKVAQDYNLSNVSTQDDYKNALEVLKANNAGNSEAR